MVPAKSLAFSVVFSLWLYAADLDLQGKASVADSDLSGDDAFRIQIGSGGRLYTFEVDKDGTLNQLGDKDEEWVVELTIPLGKMGRKDAKPGTRVHFSVSRCEVAYDGVRTCGSWGMDKHVGEFVLDP